MGAQLDRLLELSEYDNIDLRILPLAAPHYILTGGFNLLEFDRAHDVGYNDIVYLEHLIGSLYLEAEKDTYKYHIAFQRLCDFSLKPEESRQLIAEAGKRWRSVP